MWPAYRARFSFSTFARSPRRIEGRFFDLVFAPKDARSKFSDWPGRRVDGRAEQGARHRWTSAIVRRVFEEPQPRLMSDKEVALVSNEGGESSALRVALLWDELTGKLDQTPTAALGLLDIANSRNLWDSDALRTLDPAIASARGGPSRCFPRARPGISSALSRGRCWDGRFVRGGTNWSRPRRLWPRRHRKGRSRRRASRISTGRRPHWPPRWPRGLHRTSRGVPARRSVRLDQDVLGRLIVTSERLSAKAVDDPGLIHRLGEVWPSFDQKLGDELKRRLLPLLREDRQLPILLPLLRDLDRDELLSEIRNLGQSNGLRAESFVAPIVQRARELGALEGLREELLDQPASRPRDEFMFATLVPTPADIGWVAGERRLDRELAAQWLIALLRTADRGDFIAVFRNDALRERVLAALPGTALDVLRRVVTEAELPLDVHVRLFLDMLPKLAVKERRDLVGVMLRRCLRSGFGGDETTTVVMLLDIVGSDLDGRWAIKTELERGVPAPIASRNMKAFARSKAPARGRLLTAIDEAARVVDARYVMDLDGSAMEAFASLLGDAAKSNFGTALSAAGLILPLAMRSRREPVSSLVAVAFPMVYRELAKEDDVPEILKLVPFIDWDRRKSARHELVYAFMASSWPPGDLALTACRSDDVGKILRRTAKAYGGDTYINRIADDLSRLGAPCRSAIERTIANIRSDWASKLDWRD